MLTSPHFWAGNVAAVRERIAAAAAQAGRPVQDVTLVAVSKTQPPEAIRAVHDAGVTDFGENYLQEALAKQPLVPREGIAWHYIGQLQANKTRAVAETFDWVHTVDRLRIAERLATQRPDGTPPLNLCLQVMLEPEPGKGGVSASELPGLAAAVAALRGVRLRGLMCIPPETTDPQLARARFRRLRELRDELNAAGHGLDTLSMGMSGDFAEAILEGSTHVRIGTAVFGARQKR